MASHSKGWSTGVIHENILLLLLFSHYVVSDSFAIPMDCSLAGSSVHGISQARMLESVAVSFSRGFSPPRIKPVSPTLTGRLTGIFWATREGREHPWGQVNPRLATVWAEDEAMYLSWSPTCYGLQPSCLVPQGSIDIPLLCVGFLLACLYTRLGAPWGWELCLVHHVSAEHSTEPGPEDAKKKICGMNEGGHPYKWILPVLVRVAWCRSANN